MLLESFQFLLIFFSDFLYFFTGSILLPIGTPSPSLMDRLVITTVQSSELCNVYLCSGIPYLFAYHTIALYTMVPVVHPFGGFIRARDTSLVLLLPQNLHGFVAFRERCCPSRGDPLDLQCFSFTFVFNLYWRQELTPIFIV